MGVSQIKLTKEKVKKWTRLGAHDSISLPRTVRMAMDLVGRLGMQYLWMDALYILRDNGNNNIERDQVLSKMHWIYMMAGFTLCVAGGMDANSPLFGLSANSEDRAYQRNGSGCADDRSTQYLSHDPASLF